MISVRSRRKDTNRLAHVKFRKSSSPKGILIILRASGALPTNASNNQEVSKPVHSVMDRSVTRSITRNEETPSSCLAGEKSSDTKENVQSLKDMFAIAEG